MPQIDIKMPASYDFLSRPAKARFRVAHGGRGSMKSWSFARALLVKSMTKKHRILCAREILSSIKDSVHHLLSSQIDLLGLTSQFIVNRDSIVCKLTGSEFIYKGLYKNISAIRSLEGITLTWIEEAHDVSEESWTQLLPTIFRTPDSECWITFNPEFEDDSTYKRFIVAHPDGAEVRKILFSDEPTYFPAELEAQRLEDLKFRPFDYPHVWLGEPRGSGRRVYPGFDRSVHVRDFDWEYVCRTANIYQGLDMHAQYYPASIWLAIFPHPENSKEIVKWIYSEYPSREVLGDYYANVRKNKLYSDSLKDMAREFLIADHDVIIDKRMIDTRFSKGSGAATIFNATGVVQEFAKRENGGLRFHTPWEKIIDVQRTSIIKDLSYNTLLPLSITNRPQLYVSATCENMIQSFTSHRLVDNSEREDERFKDFSDALRICLAGVEAWHEPSKPRGVGVEPEHIWAGFETHLADFSDKKTSWMGY